MIGEYVEHALTWSETSLLSTPSDNSEPRSTRRPRRRRLLVIEPDPDTSRRLQLLLEPQYEVTAVSSALIGLRNVLETARFDLVVCELSALELTGMRLFDDLAELGQKLDRLALMASSIDSPRAGCFLEESGGPWLRKPFLEQDFLAFVDSRLNL
ncbi:MAG: response regulator [Polyangiaceae bacterium]|nr:response regulator [Polyangiaceae bacterium]